MIKFAESPMGGSVTLFSMLFIALIGYWYAVYVGLMTAVAYGLVPVCYGANFLYVPQMILDYPLAFGALVAGFFANKNTRTSGLVISLPCLDVMYFAVISGVNILRGARKEHLLLCISLTQCNLYRYRKRLLL